MAEKNSIPHRAIQGERKGKNELRGHKKAQGHPENAKPYMFCFPAII